MNSEIRTSALSCALGFYGDHPDMPVTPADVVTTAGIFVSFLSDTAAPVQGAASPAKPAATKEPKKDPTPKPAETKAPAANDGAKAAPELNYEKDVKAPMMDLAAKKGRDAVSPIFEKFKVKNAKELKPEQWPDFIAEVKRVMEDASVPLTQAAA